MRLICLFALGWILSLDPVYGVSGYNHAMMIQTNTTRYPTTRWLKICNSSKLKASKLRNFLKENVDLLYL
tara:strand:+ start:918 stop:1127 length:210 start_codon:yes stop_codon:yes gene_type:complete